MAKKSLIARQAKRERLTQKYAQRRKELKDSQDYEALDQLPRNSSAVRLRNRCQITGRGRGYMRRFGLCRILFREMASEGKIPGIRKASW